MNQENGDKMYFKQTLSIFSSNIILLMFIQFTQLYLKYCLSCKELLCTHAFDEVQLLALEKQFQYKCNNND